jgi:hypothetical protein
MQHTAVPAFVAGSEAIAQFLGYWPTFHDYEVTAVELHRSGPSFLRLNGTGPEGDIVNRIHFTITLDDLQDLELYAFSLQNVLSGITFAEQEQFVRVELEPIWGIHGFLLAARVSIDFKVETSRDEHARP